MKEFIMFEELYFMDRIGMPISGMFLIIFILIFAKRILELAVDGDDE